MKAVIPAAGLGTRFLPATKVQPKEMMPVVDKPTIQYIVEEAIDSGIANILIITDKRKRTIEDHFDRSFELEYNLQDKDKPELAQQIKDIGQLANIHYVRQKEPKGLGDAVYHSKAYVENGPFSVLLGDDIIQSSIPLTKSLIELNKEYDAPILAVEEIPKEKTQSYGVIDISTQVSDNVFLVDDLVEKPSPSEAPSNYGIVGRYLLDSDIFPALEEIPKGVGGEYQLTDAIQSLLPKRDIYAFKFSGSRYDIGTIPGWIKANIELAQQNPKYSPQIQKYLSSL